MNHPEIYWWRLSATGLKFVAAALMFAFLFSENLVEAQTRRSGSTRKVGTSQAVSPGTELRLRLVNTINTKTAKDGDTFSATVLTPDSYAQAVVEGHVLQIKPSGKVTGKTELKLAFDRLRLPTGTTLKLNAQLVKIYDADSVKDVDEAGNVKSGSQGTTTAIRTGGGAAIGAVVGAIAGGGKGAAIGAAVGGAAGAGSVLIQGSKKIVLESGTEMLIRTTR